MFLIFENIGKSCLFKYLLYIVKKEYQLRIYSVCIPITKNSKVAYLNTPPLLHGSSNSEVQQFITKQLKDSTDTDESPICRLKRYTRQGGVVDLARVWLALPFEAPFAI